jgi:type II secretory pathway component PulF
LWQSLAGTFFYLFFVFSILSSTTIFMMWKIVPAMDKIFDDFGAQLPAVTQMLMAASDFIVNYGFIFVYWPLSVIYLIGFYVLLRYVGWVRFGLPGLQWLGLPLHRATILSCLAIVVEQGKPLVEALIALKDCYPRYFVRRRLERTAGSVQRGEHWQVAMRRYGLLTTADAAILQAAERVGNLPWAMREMADRALRRYYYRMQAATQMLALLLLLALGLLGCFIAVGMFAPLAKLINSLA